MQFEYSVTVFITTYNPVWKKLESTLMSVITQKNIDFEVIIADDCSISDYTVEIENYFQTYNFNNYKLIKHEINVGTVRNCYDAFIEAKGEYLFGVSPGDMLYNETTLYELYKFAKINNADTCFGHAVYYNNNNKLNILSKKYNDPKQPCLFEDKDALLYLLFGNSILGAVFFRKKVSAIKYIGEIIGISKYVEDNTSAAFALADGVHYLYYNKYVVWYEYGTGVSTSKNKRWEEVLRADFDMTYNKLYEKYKDNYVINVFHKVRKMNKIKKIFFLLWNCPLLFFRILKFKCTKPLMANVMPMDKSILKKYLQIENEDYNANN